MAPKFTTRAVLLAGFGGLLILMAFAGFDAVGILGQIQARNDSIRRDFLARSRLLERIRSDVYVSGTYVRDYLLEHDPGLAETHRASLDLTRKDMDAALIAYQRLLPGEETAAFSGLKKELEDYWRVLNPVFQWDRKRRLDLGFLFQRDEVLRRRANMLGIADQIASLNEQQLNAGDRQVATLFEQFKLRLGVTLAATLGLGLLLAAFSIVRILGLESETAARYQEIVLARRELKHLSARLVEAQENERRAISRELHDEVGQSLSALLIELGNLAAAIGNGSSGELRGHVEVIKGLAESSMGVVRNMALLLRPSMLDDFGLVPALQWKAREISKRIGMRVDVTADHVSDDLPEGHKTCIYRVVQEALHNCSRHAHAHVVRISVEQRPDRILLEVQDDGRGFEPRQRGLGLLGMEERVTHLGGSFHVESAPGRGTLINIVLPLAS